MEVEIVKKVKRTMAMLLASLLLVSMAACGETKSESSETQSSKSSQASVSEGDESEEAESSEAETEGTGTADSDSPIKISMYYSDNATLPFKEDWLTVETIKEKYNVDRLNLKDGKRYMMPRLHMTSFMKY